MTSPPDAAPHAHDHASQLGTLRECQDCGLFQDIGALVPGDAAHCRRCNATLRRGAADGTTKALVCYLSALVLLVFAVQMPFLDLRTVGRTYQATLFTGPAQLKDFGMWEISIVVLITLVAVPFIQLALVLTVLIGLRVPHPSPRLRYLYGWVETLRPWSMIEVFLLGCFVAYSRLQAMAEVQVGPALIALGGVMLAMVAADIVLDHEEVWAEFEARGLRGEPAGPAAASADRLRLLQAGAACARTQPLPALRHQAAPPQTLQHQPLLGAAGGGHRALCAGQHCCR